MLKKATIFTLAAITGGIFFSCENLDSDRPETATGYDEKQQQTTSTSSTEFDEDAYMNTALPDFRAYESADVRREKFFQFLKPIVEHENQRVLSQRAFVKKCFRAFQQGWELDEERLNRLEEIAREYRLHNMEFDNTNAFEKVLLRVDKIPESLALIQAANESAWGTSYFAREGNNLFGQWCFTEDCGLVPRNRPEGAKHQVAVYPSVALSVRAYIRNLNTHAAYSYLRNLRYEMRLENKPLKSDYLALGLQKYSSKGMEYVNILRSMLKSNERYI